MKLLPFNDYDLKTPRILETLNEASRSLAELKGFANSIPNQHILINAITINAIIILNIISITYKVCGLILSPK